MPSRTENVAVVRAALSGLAAATGMDEEGASNLKTAVSEACNNVSLHAYADDQDGPMFVSVDCADQDVDVIVRDHGHGLGRISPRGGHMGLGVAVINALADHVEYSRVSGGGTQVQFHFSHILDGPGAAAASPVDRLPEHRDPPAIGSLSGDVQVWCSDASLQRFVLARVLTFVAASAHFAVTSVQDLARATRAVADHVDHASHGWIGLGDQLAAPAAPAPRAPRRQPTGWGRSPRRRRVGHRGIPGRRAIPRGGHRRPAALGRTGLKSRRTGNRGISG